MASLYKNNGIWYIAVSHNGTRKCRSLKTKDIKVAKSIKSYAETIILQELGGFIKSNAKLSFSELVDHFLKAPHSWSTATYDLNKYILTSHLVGKSLPDKSHIPCHTHKTHQSVLELGNQEQLS